MAAQETAVEEPRRCCAPPPPPRSPPLPRVAAASSSAASSPISSLRPQELLSQDGLFSSNKQVQTAALCSLSTLMTITPKDTYLEFEKHFIGLQERTLHDSFSENDIKIFCTPEGQLSTEQGVYVAEAVASKNTELAKGHFHAYGDQDVDTALSVVPAKTQKRESSGTGKRETGKSTKKTVDKAKTAKGEARELLLKEEASVRMKVGQVKKNLSLMLDALGELAIANPMFIHGQLPSLVKYVEPLLSSAIVSDAAFRTMVSLAGTARPLCNLASEIAAAIRVIMEEDSKKKQSSGLFEKIVNGLKIACKAGPLPAESFTFVFPIMERILLSSKKTCLHDDVLHILSMHLDPILPLPRPRMLSVLYHVLSTVPAYCTSVGPMLNELCLGLRSHELAQALVGVYAKEVHVRIACLNAIKCVPIHSVQQDLLVSGSLWIATHDPKNEVAELANELWDHFGFDEITDYSGILDALYHKNYNVPGASAEALSAALDENPDKMQNKSKKASWTLYDNLVFVKMCIEEKESCGEVSQNTYQANHFIEKFFFKTGKVFMPEQFKHKFLKLQNTHNRWEDLDHLNDRRKRNPTKTLKDFTKKRPLYENLPGLIDLLIKIFKDCPNKIESDDVSDIVLEHSSTVNTHSNCLDENSIINTLEDTLEDTIESLKMKLEQSMKQKEKVEKCLKTEEGKRKRAEECLKTEEDKRKRAEKEVHNLKEQMMALRGHISAEVRSILDVYKS